MRIRNRALSFLLRGLITIGILYWVLSSTSIQDYQNVIMGLSLPMFIGILILVMIQVVLLAVRWYLLAKAAGSHISIPLSILGILMSFFFSQGLPASIGGDSFRIWWHRREGINTSISLQIIFFDRIYGMLSLILLCVVSVVLLALLTEETTKTLILCILLAGTGCVLTLSLMPWRIGLSGYIEHISRYLPQWLNKCAQWIVTLRQSLRQQPLSMSLCLLGIGLLTHLCVIAQVYAIGHMLNPSKINIVICLATVPPALFISYMPFSIAGWGVREASMVVALGLFGVQAATAILISLTIGMIILCFALVGGFLWMTGGFRAAYLTESNDKSIESLSISL